MSIDYWRKVSSFKIAIFCIFHIFSPGPTSSVARWWLCGRSDGTNLRVVGKIYLIFVDLSVILAVFWGLIRFSADSTFAIFADRPYRRALSFWRWSLPLAKIPRIIIWVYWSNLPNWANSNFWTIMQSLKYRPFVGIESWTISSNTVRRFPWQAARGRSSTAKY